MGVRIPVVGARPVDRLRATVGRWRLRRGLGKCEAMDFKTGQFCKRTAYGCVIVYGLPRHVCAWHVEPLTHTDNEYGPILFLSRWIRLPHVAIPNDLAVLEAQRLSRRLDYSQSPNSLMS